MVYNQCVLPVMTYGAGTLRFHLEGKLGSAPRVIERRIGVMLRGRELASCFREQSRVEDIVAQIKRKWTWIGHVMQKTSNRGTI